ncbi:hypothetical protein [Spongiimicrobium salis]|uniref:hypothetical protein n=1 Tax=Spongiimicrobium salis TaxID=1667022 RepID=UPI00374CF981
MGKLLFFSSLMILFFSCSEKKSDAAITDSAEVEFDVTKLPKKIRLDSKATAILKDWPEFNAIEASFDALLKVKNLEDLDLALEALTESEEALEQSTYPERFDNPEIRSRQKVFKTYILKASASLVEFSDPLPSMLEMVTAYNAYRNQFNVIVNNTLDINLILDE